MEKINVNGQISRHYDLDEILSLDIPDSTKKSFKENFKKRVYFDYKDGCRLGTLIGLEMNYMLSNIFYIIETNNGTLYIPITNSITKLCA